MIGAEVIQSNWTEFRNRIDEYFKTRSVEIHNMYDDLEERIVFQPASSIDYFHNTFAGGYVDHVLRVMDFSSEFFEMYQKLGLITDNFTMEELMFAAMHHDLGKMGFPGDGNEGYLANDSKWHRENLGKMYNLNPNIPFGTVQDKSLYLLQHYKIHCSWNEWMGIRIHDGAFEDVNKPYWTQSSLSGRQRTNLAIILHQSDYAAARWEFERWATTEQKFNLNQTQLPTPESLPSKQIDSLDIFDSVFN